MKRPSRKAWAWTGGILAVLWVIGAAQDFASDTNQDVTQNVASVPSSTAASRSSEPPTVPELSEPARTIEVTRVEVPEPCMHYLELMDDTLQAVYDYEQGIAPSDQALSDALQAMVESDAPGLNDARTQLNQIENDTTGALQQIVEAHQELAQLHEGCNAALEANNE